jgi:hypothetical protein
MILNSRGIFGPGLGKSSTAQTASGAVAPLNPISDWQLWYDLTDITTLFQDTAGTTPITADGQEIALCTNKGSYGAAGDVSQTTAAKPAYDTDLVSWGGMVTTSAGADWLFTATAVEQTDFASGDMSCWMVYSTSNAGSNNWYFDWNSTEMRMLILGAGTHNYAMGGGSATVAATATDNTVVSLHQWDTGSNVQGMDLSFDTENGVTASASSGPANDIVFYLGATAGSGGFDGTIHELCIRTPELTAGEITSMKSYVLDKYGVTWA